MKNINLTPQFVQSVRDAVNVVDVAGDHTRLTRRGGRHHGLCPLHKEKTPSFSVDPAQGLFYCFGCGAGGDAIRLHMLLTGDDFPGAIEALAGRYGIPLPRTTEARGSGGSEADRKRRQDRRIEAALEAALAYFQKNLRTDSPGSRYLAERRVPRKMIELYGMGYAPDGWQNLIDALSGRVPQPDLVAAGLVAKKEETGRVYDRFRHRLIFPIHTAAGRLVGFGGRTLGDDRAKYVNTSETDRFHKGSLLYGLTQARKSIREEGRVLLVEGYFDVVGAAASGIDWAVAGMGTALTTEQARLLARYADEVVVGYDGDSAGENAFRRALPLMLGVGLQVRRARFGEGEDPDSLRLKAGPEAVVEAVALAEDAVELEIERLCPTGAGSVGGGAVGRPDPHARARAADGVAALLAALPDAIVRHGYARRAAERMRMPEGLLLERIDRERGTSKPRGGPPGRPGPSMRGGPGMGSGPGDPRGPAGDAPFTGAGAAGPGRSSRPSEVASLEEATLGALLGSGDAAPPVDALPEEEIFFDPDCRNIFRSFYDLYRNGGRPPASNEVTRALGADHPSVDRLAKILLESPTSQSDVDLTALFETLSRRWRGQRLKELARDMQSAERAGNRELLERLYQERSALSRRHHRG